jgi:hypothetical protein
VAWKKGPNQGQGVWWHESGFPGIFGVFLAFSTSNHQLLMRLLRLVARGEVRENLVQFGAAFRKDTLRQYVYAVPSLAHIDDNQRSRQIISSDLCSRIIMGDRSRSAERLKTPGNKSTGTPKLPSVRPPTRLGGAASQKSSQAGNSNPNYSDREQEKLMSKWRVNVSRSRLCESAKCSFGGWRCPECVKEIIFGHCMLFEEMEGKVNLILQLLY